jgi:glycosyltransferase involved in cell wall biosynthesis
MTSSDLEDIRPRFTVVMPAHNTAAIVGAAIRSVLQQTCPDFELIVVDDGSTDETADAVTAMCSDSRIVLVRQANSGAASARNNAMGRARGEYISFIDSDDLWMPTYLEAMQSALDQTPDAGFAYTDAWTLDPAARRIGKTTAMEWQRPPAVPPPTAELLLLALLDRNFVYTAVSVRRSVIEDVGPFDESLRGAIDYEMWLRIAARGYRAVRPPGLLAVYRRGRPGSISANRAGIYANLIRVYERVADEWPVSDRARETARKQLKAARSELAGLEGGSSLDAIWRVRLRPALAELKRAVRHGDRWLASPPPEILEAFPELGSSGSAAAELTE